MPANNENREGSQKMPDKKMGKKIEEMECQETENNLYHMEAAESDTRVIRNNLRDQLK